MFIDNDNLLALTRGIHLAASAEVAGCLVFLVFVAEPALRPWLAASHAIQSRMVLLSWMGLLIAAATGVVWLMLVSTSMSGLAIGQALRSGEVLAVIRETQFGWVFEIRGVLFVLLAACLCVCRFAVARSFALAASLALVAALAWAGHAGATPGPSGDTHLAADVMHLWAASAWFGGLIGLATLFADRRRCAPLARRSLQLDAVNRFSILGIVSVIILSLSGLVNGWFLVGSFPALLATDYGRLLLLKLAAFVVMLGCAAINRFYLTPRLALIAQEAANAKALMELKRNIRIELAGGLAIFFVVGLLGMMHPAIHLVPPSSSSTVCGKSATRASLVHLQPSWAWRRKIILASGEPYR